MSIRSRRFSRLDKGSSSGTTGQPRPTTHTGPKIGFDLVKINKHGARQNRTLMISEDGVSNVKGKSAQWFYPACDVHSIQIDSENPKVLVLSLITRYCFEAATEGEARRILSSFQQLKLGQQNNNSNNNNGSSTTPRERSKTPTTPSSSTAAATATATSTTTTTTTTTATTIDAMMDNSTSGGDDSDSSGASSGAEAPRNPVHRNNHNNKHTLDLHARTTTTTTTSFRTTNTNNNNNNTSDDEPASPKTPKSPKNPSTSASANSSSSSNNNNNNSNNDKNDAAGEKKKITIDDFELLKNIGRGSFSKVILVRKKDSGKIYAMKVLKKEELYKRNQVEHTNTEKNILATLSNPFIVKMFYSFQTKDKLYMALEYVSGGELFFHLKRAGRFPEELARFYAAEVICALEFLHSHDIIYRDLKPENIMLASDGHIKITDFGLSKAGITSIGGSAEGQKTRTFAGTPDYLAPEIIQGIGHGKAVDWWSVGILLYEMLNGSPPFKGKNRNELYHATIKGEVVFPNHMSREAISLVKALLARRPEDRLGSRGVDEIKSHPFFAPVRWDLLAEKKEEPPFKPVVRDLEDTANFDVNFTAQQIADSYADTSALNDAGDMSPSFVNFSYTASDGCLSPSCSSSN